MSAALAEWENLPLCVDQTDMLTLHPYTTTYQHDSSYHSSYSMITSCARHLRAYQLVHSRCNSIVGDVRIAAPLQAREALRAAEDAEARGAPEATELVAVADPLRDRWDCESVLSLRSNLDNHPARIAEPAHSRKPRTGFGAAPDAGRPARIVLSAKTGLPVIKADSAGARRQGGEQPGPSNSAPPAVQPRKDETQEQKKARKAATKEANVRRLPCHLRVCDGASYWTCRTTSPIRC